MVGTHLLSNHLGHHIPGMHIDGAYGHDLLPVPLGEWADQHADEGFELGHLLLVIVLHGALIAFLQPGKGHAHLCGPPDLSAGQGHLGHRQSLRKAITRTVSKTSPLTTLQGLRIELCEGIVPLCCPLPTVQIK